MGISFLFFPYGIFLFSFGLRHAAFGILVPGPGIKPVLSAVKAWIPNHWTARELPPYRIWVGLMHNTLQRHKHHRNTPASSVYYKVFDLDLIFALLFFKT